MNYAYIKICIVLMILSDTNCKYRPSAPPFAIPQAKDVDQIIASAEPLRVMDEGRTTVVKDTRQIERFVAHLSRRNNEWKRHFGTEPTSEWTFIVHSRGEPSLVLWLGPDWLGGREEYGKRDYRSQSLSRKDRAEFLTILGLQKD